MKKPQYITLIISAAVLTLLLVFARTKPFSNAAPSDPATQHAGAGEHQHDHAGGFSIDSVIQAAQKQLDPGQSTRLSLLEKSITRGDVKAQQIEVYHQLIHFWRDTGKAFLPFAWYTAESARLENSEKNLTFAAHLLLNRLQQEENGPGKVWMGLQAKDLFERALAINPGNDSSKVGLGATYLFGGFSEAPMEGIAKIREVVEKDSTNIYAQMTLATGSLMSGQLDKAVQRLETVNKLDPKNLQAIIMLADAFERQADKTNAVKWYSKALPLVKDRQELKSEIEKRVGELSK